MSTRKSIAAFGLEDSLARTLGRLRLRRYPRQGMAALLVGACLTFVCQSSWAWEFPAQPQTMGQDSHATVVHGDSLYEVARRSGFALEHLAEANGLPVSLARLEVSKVVLPTRRILPHASPAQGVVVNLPERGFYVFSQSNKPRFFPIAVGEPGRFATPTGSFTIVEKVENPDWIAPEWAGLGEDNVVPAGPDNPLGDRWIGLSSPGLGIHSTNNPSSIGSATSHGCMRMYPELARSAFDLVKTGWPVGIEYVLGRVAIEREGILVAGFADIYSRGGGQAQVREAFEREELLGFYRPEPIERILRERRGVPETVVDLRPKAWLGADWFQAARVDGTLYVEQTLLEKAGVTFEFSLAEREVTLRRGDKAVSLPLYVASAQDPREGEAFLSRGSGWLPARAALTAMGLSMTWEAAPKRLRVFD